MRSQTWRGRKPRSKGRRWLAEEEVKKWLPREITVESDDKYSKADDRKRKAEPPHATLPGFHPTYEPLPPGCLNVFTCLSSLISVVIAVFSTFPCWILAAITVFGVSLAYGSSSHALYVWSDYRIGQIAEFSLAGDLVPPSARISSLAMYPLLES